MANNARKNINSPQSGCPTRLATRLEAAQDLSRYRCLRLLPRIVPWQINRSSNLCTESLDFVKFFLEIFLYDILNVQKKKKSRIYIRDFSSTRIIQLYTKHTM